MYWYLKALRQYTNYFDRADRREYWMFALFNVVFSLLALIIDSVVGGLNEKPYGWISLIYCLAVLVPGITVGIRRLHDAGKSGKMLFLAFIPVIGTIWLLVLLMKKSESGENPWGKNPQTTQTDPAAEDDLARDTLVTLVILWAFFTHVFWLIVPKMLDEPEVNERIRVVSVLFRIVWPILIFSLAFAVKNKTRRIIVLVAGTIYLIYGFYELYFDQFN